MQNSEALSEAAAQKRIAQFYPFRHVRQDKFGISFTGSFIRQCEPVYTLLEYVEFKRNAAICQFFCKQDRILWRNKNILRRVP